jgi:hypothetical protein
VKNSTWTCILNSFVLLAATTLVSCASTGGGSEEWLPLFDGESVAGWTMLDGAPVTGWGVEDGALTRQKRSGDIYTAEEYDNFVLEFGFKIAEGGNSGVKYRMQWYGESYLGPEFQILDDVATSPGRDPSTGKAHWGTAGLYVIDPGEWTIDPRKPAGEWNHGKIVADGSRFEHWLNGHLIVSIDTGSERYAKGVAASKFRNRENYGQNPSGRIMLQEHGSGVWFKNVRLRRLP